MPPQPTARPDSAEMPLREVIEEVVSRGQVKVPPYPSTALRLQAVLASDYDISQLVDVMRTDQVFTGNLLRLANSALYRRGNEVTSISAAVSRIGSRELTRLAMASAVGQLATGLGLLRPLRRKVWRESFASALLCEAMASDASLDASEAFVAGLLHDAGKLLVLSAIEEVLQRHPSEALDEASCLALVDKHHVTLGGLLAERWKLPGVLGAVIVSHHEPSAQGSGLTQLVTRSDAIVFLMETQPEVTATMLGELQLLPSLVSKLTELIPRIPALINALDASTGDAPSPSTNVAAKNSTSQERRLEVVGGKTVWPVRQLSPQGLCVESSAALQSHTLLEVILQPEQLQFWALVSECTPTENGFSAWLKPFSLSASAGQQWVALLTAH